jgi:hypothetical protein
MKSLRILHVANRAEKHWGNKYYSFPYKINNGFVRNGHCVYWFSDRDVSRSLALIPSRKLGVGACNRKLLEVCNNFRPDVIVLGHAEIIKHETLAEIKTRHNPIIVEYDIDLLHADNLKKIAGRSGYVDFYFIGTGGKVLGEIAAKGTRCTYIPNPVDPSIDYLENHSRADLPVEVFFAGQISHMVDTSDLRTQIASLPQDMPEVKFGYFNGVWGHAYLRLVEQARMGLSISVGLKNTGQGDGSYQYLYSSDRISQYLGNGLLTFVEKRFCLSDIYGPDCLVEVEGYEELKYKIAFFARRNDLRMQQAGASHSLVHEEFNERLVAQYMLEVATGQSYSHDYRWPTRVWEETADSAHGSKP